MPDKRRKISQRCTCRITFAVEAIANVSLFTATLKTANRVEAVRLQVARQLVIETLIIVYTNSSKTMMAVLE